MSLFNLFHIPKEDDYNNYIKKLIISQTENETTITNLRVRVKSVQYFFKNLVLDMKKLDSELGDFIIQKNNWGVRKILKKKNDLKLKGLEILKLQNGFEEDFILGVSLKMKELVTEEISGNTFLSENPYSLIYTKVPPKYGECLIFIRELSNEYYLYNGRWIELEEIKLWK